MLSDADQKLIEAAVVQAEEKTSGKIVCIVAKSVSTYPEVSLAWAATGALLLPPLMMWMGLRPTVLVDWAQGWTASAGFAWDSKIMILVAGYALLQAAIFLVLAFVTSTPSIRTVITPHVIKKQRVHHAAYEQYLATGLHQTDARTGVVIFVSLDDRCVSIIADELIHKSVGNEIWNRAVLAVQDGMRTNASGVGLVRAIEICGAALATHFPGRSANILPNKPLEL